ncbi:MAG: FAD-dependent oxidoreductase [Actinomycetota bacterium]
MEQQNDLPVVVVGAGPIGLSAAANLLDRGLKPVVLEAGDAIASNVRDWAHVHLFSPWQYLVDPVSERMLDAAGWQRPPDSGHPNGGQLIDQFLQPLADLPQMAGIIRLNHRVKHITRHGVDKVKSDGRDTRPFIVVADAADSEVRIMARAVIDATGTWNQPNPIGAGGVPAIGEEQAAADGIIRYGIPDLLGAEKAMYTNKRVAVIGSGHSAQNVIRDLAALTAEASETATTWLIRRDEAGQMFGGGGDDQLAARGELGADAKRLATGGAIDFITGFRLEQVLDNGGEVYLVSTDGVKAGPFDLVVANTGARPDLDMVRELRLDIDPGIESTTTMAPLIDPNIHSCGSVRPHGVDELSHHDPGYYAIGMKSYGRAPTFLLMTGYEQARSVVAEIAGDHEAARRIELILPETGVCSSNLGESEPKSGCCGPTVADADVTDVDAAALGGCGTETTDGCGTPAEANSRPTEDTSGCCGPSPAAVEETSGGCCG